MCLGKEGVGRLLGKRYVADILWLKKIFFELFQRTQKSNPGVEINSRGPG